MDYFLKIKELMKRNLSQSLTLYTTPNFPRKVKQSSCKKYEVTLGIGGNIGDVQKRFNKLFCTLLRDKRFHILSTSPLLKNPPFGYLDQDDFLNGVIVLKTNMGLNEFFKSMQRLENRYGRKRSFQDAPRTLDIDIIFFANKKIHTKKLIIPHKDWANRESVTIPLKYMNKLSRR